MYQDAAAAASAFRTLNAAPVASGNGNSNANDVAISIATSLQTAVAENTQTIAGGVTPTIATDAVTPLAATATGSSGETIEANVVSSSLQLAVSTADINGLAADATFGNNLQSAIATTLNVDPSTVAIKSVNVVNGELQVEYDVVY